MSDRRVPSTVTRKEFEELISHAQRNKVTRLKWRDVEVEFYVNDHSELRTKASGPDDILFSDQ